MNCREPCLSACWPLSVTNNYTPIEYFSSGLLITYGLLSWTDIMVRLDLDYINMDTDISGELSWLDWLVSVQETRRNTDYPNSAHTSSLCSQRPEVVSAAKSDTSAHCISPLACSQKHNLSSSFIFFPRSVLAPYLNRDLRLWFGWCVMDHQHAERLFPLPRLQQSLSQSAALEMRPLKRH